MFFFVFCYGMFFFFSDFMGWDSDLGFSGSGF